MSAEKKLRLARAALRAWERECQVLRMHPGAMVTKEWVKDWMDARNNTVDLRWFVDSLAGSSGAVSG